MQAPCYLSWDAPSPPLAVLGDRQHHVHSAGKDILQTLVKILKIWLAFTFHPDLLGGFLFFFKSRHAFNSNLS